MQKHFIHSNVPKTSANWPLGWEAESFQSVWFKYWKEALEWNCKENRNKEKIEKLTRNKQWLELALSSTWRKSELNKYMMKCDVSHWKPVTFKTPFQSDFCKWRYGSEGHWLISVCFSRDAWYQGGRKWTSPSARQLSGERKQLKSKREKGGRMQDSISPVCSLGFRHNWEKADRWDLSGNWWSFVWTEITLCQLHF